MKNYKNIYLLVKNKKFNSAINELNKIKNDEVNSFEYNYLKGFSFLNLNKIDDAVENLSSAIQINQGNVLPYFYRGIAYLKLNKFDLAKSDYTKAISLKPDFPELYNNLANINYRKGENEEAIKNYIDSINLNKKMKSSILGLLNVLSQTNNVKDCGLDLIQVHNKLNKILFNYSKNEIIENKKIKTYLNEINNIIDNQLDDLNLNLVQTYKENKFPPNCNRHHKIFNKNNIIPEYCFGCYKIQIDPENVIDLIKIHIIFDNFNFENNNMRKCMIELRPNIVGNYKSFVYCKTLEEAENILQELSEVLKKNLNKEIKIKIKRGCSEFSIKFPQYQNLKKDTMMYNKSWKNTENSFDKENLEFAKERKIRPTIKGATLFDAVVIRNWLAFAKLIGDNSYKQVSDKDFYSNFIEEKLKAKLLQKQQLN